MSKTTTFYINENEDVFQFFAKQGLDLSARLVEKLDFISKKTHNNYIGYYQFVLEGHFYKFFVIPKIHKGLKDIEKEGQFMSFLGRFYELKNKYPEIKAKDIEGNIVDLSFADFSNKGSKTTEAFICQKYIYALKIIQSFFRKHNRSRRQKQKYVAQSIRHQIDLKNSIRSVDKSKVHQVRKEAEAFSILAFVAIYALRQFKKEQLPQFEETIFELKKLTNSTLNIIQKKYKSDPHFKFKDRDIITNKIAKLFKKSSELKRVYDALLIILGLEDFKGRVDSRTAKKIDNMLALFFNPASLFEWVVYDKLMQEFDGIGVVKMDRKGETQKIYHLTSNASYYLKTSQPDFIIEKGDNIQIIDAKWKIIASPNEIQFSDIAKLKRDCDLRREKGKSIEMASLIYPKVGFEIANENPFHLDYDFSFGFYVEEIKV